MNNFGLRSTYELFVFSSLEERSGGCGISESSDTTDDYENADKYYSALKKRHSVRYGYLNLAELLFAATVCTVEVEHKCIGIVFELELVSEDRAFVKHGFGCAASVITGSGLVTVLKAGCIAVRDVLGEGVTGGVESNVLSGNLNAANGTVNYVILATGVKTVGSVVILNLICTLGMTESVKSNVLAGNLNVTYGAVNYVILATGSYTVGVNVVFYNSIHFGVTESVKSNVLARNLNVTYGAVNYVILAAGVETVGVNVVFYNSIHFGMTESVKSNVLARNLNVTYRTVNYVILATGSYTVGSNVVLGNCRKGIVTGCSTGSTDSILGSTAVVTDSSGAAVGGTGCVVVKYVIGEGVTESSAYSSESFSLATAVVTSSGLCTVKKTGSVTVVYVVGEGVTESSAFSSEGLGSATAVVTFSGLCTVEKAGSVTVVYVVGKGVTESGNGERFKNLKLCVKVKRTS